MDDKCNMDCEKIIESLEAVFQEEGYETLLINRGTKNHHTTNYEKIVVKRSDGRMFDISIDERVDWLDPIRPVIRTNIFDDRI